MEATGDLQHFEEIGLSKTLIGERDGGEKLETMYLGNSLEEGTEAGRSEVKKSFSDEHRGGKKQKQNWRCRRERGEFQSKIL